MNLIRLIKLKKLNGELDDLTEQESYFLSFFDNLRLKDGYYYDIDNGVTYFYFNLKNNTLYFLLSFENKYGGSTQTTKIFIDNILRTRLNLNNVVSDICRLSMFIS